MSKVIIHLKGGKSYETTEANLTNTQRLLAGQIVGIEREGDNAISDLADSIDDELIVEISGNEDSNDSDVVEIKLPTLKELEGTDKDVLRKMADDLAELEGITKANHRAGVKKLAEYIFENQNK